MTMKSDKRYQHTIKAYYKSLIIWQQVPVQQNWRNKARVMLIVERPATRTPGVEPLGMDVHLKQEY